MRFWYGVRLVGNVVNLTTIIGLLMAKAGGAKLHRRPHGIWLATGYRFGFPVASAFCLGNLLISHHDLDFLLARPRLLLHEERHSWQYLVFLGAPYWLFYGIGMLWSLLRTGDRGSANPFEIAAGLADGGYEELPRRNGRQMWAAVKRAPHAAIESLSALMRRRAR
jgi:hypothetical protein